MSGQTILQSALLKKRLNEQRMIARDRERHLLAIDGVGQGGKQPLPPTLLQGDGAAAFSSLARREAEIRRHMAQRAAPGAPAAAAGARRERAKKSAAGGLPFCAAKTGQSRKAAAGQKTGAGATSERVPKMQQRKGSLGKRYPEGLDCVGRGLKLPQLG